MARFLSKRYTEYLIYLIFWCTLLLSPIWGSMLGGSHSQFTWDEMLTFWEFLLPAVVLFLINNSILVPFFLYKKRGGYYIVYMLCVLVAICLVYIFYTGFDGPEGRRPRRQGNGHRVENRFDLTPGKEVPSSVDVRADRDRDKQHGPPMVKDKKVLFAISNPDSVRILLVVFVLVFNLCVRLTFFVIRRDERYRELEKEKLKTELEYLKYQINPHFFMNTLNNIHALIEIDKEKSKESIIELSKMMRYVLYDAVTPLVPLEKEVVFLTSYIDLMRLRYTDKLKVRSSLDVSGADSVYIPSLLLIVFVENAFKHGVTYKKESDISISLSVDEEQGVILFSCTNGNYGGGKFDDGRAGIGVANARKRLDLLYGKSAELKIDESSDRYSVELKIPLCYDKVYNC